MTNTRKLTTMAILTALSVCFVALIHFPIFPAVAFLEYDPADIPILICGFAFGPAAGFIVTLIAAFIQGFTVSAQSGIYGIIMHIVATGAYVLSSSLFYRKHKTKKMAAVAIGIGTLTMVVCMFFANLVITPYFLMGAVNSGTPCSRSCRSSCFSILSKRAPTARSRSLSISASSTCSSKTKKPRISLHDRGLFPPVCRRAAADH